MSSSTIKNTQFQFRLSVKEKKTIDEYLERKHIKNKSKWILKLIDDAIKNDEVVGILEYTQEQMELN